MDPKRLAATSVNADQMPQREKLNWTRTEVEIPPGAGVVPVLIYLFYFILQFSKFFPGSHCLRLRGTLSLRLSPPLGAVFFFVGMGSDLQVAVVLGTYLAEFEPAATQLVSRQGTIQCNHVK